MARGSELLPCDWLICVNEGLNDLPKSLMKIDILQNTKSHFTLIVSSHTFSISSFTCRPAKDEDTCFQALEVLMLDDNELTSGVFSSLKNLTRSVSFPVKTFCIHNIHYKCTFKNSACILPAFVRHSASEKLHF